MSNLDPTARYSETLVVGAGPVGLAGALALRSMGREVTLLEAGAEGRARLGSRAIFIHRATLQLLEKLSPGLGWEIAGQGLVWPTKRTFYRGKEVFVRHYPTPDPKELPPFTSLPQVRIEAYLMAAGKAAGVSFAWNGTVKEVKTTEAGVELKLESGEIWTTKYLIAADGGRSAVRHSLGIKMEGSRSNNSYVVVDVTEDEADPLPKERVFHYEHPGVERRNVLLVPFVGGWRVDLQCKDTDNPEEFSGIEGVRRWLPKVMPAKYADRITWVSTYQFLQLVAKEFTDPQRRVLLAGEAAHLFAPFGARGMNSGIPDAAGAARAIDKALKASTPAEALEQIDEFARTRRAAAEYNRDAAGRALAHIQVTGWRGQLKRIGAAKLAPYWKRLGAWLDEGPYGPRKGPPGQAGGGKY